ncbi:MAG: GNAT family N-acetyltransferase [Fusobacterium varium]|uniref:GNAT family N-acetyltransferase n=1 Tax=Fusobacterium varium TaxID=856 RepID=UPI0039940720
MIEGKKIILRAYKESDIEISFKLINTLNIRTMLGRNNIFPFSMSAQKEFVEKAMINNGPTFNFAIEEKESGEYIGGCGINSYDDKNRKVIIGLWLGEQYQRKGYGSDVLRTLCRFIFDEMNIHKIVLDYFSFNEKGKKCYEAVGFKQEGIRRKELFRFGKYHDIIEMGLFKEELILKED